MNNQRKLSYFNQQPNEKDFFLKKNKEIKVNMVLKLVLTPKAISALNK